VWVFVAAPIYIIVVLGNVLKCFLFPSVFDLACLIAWGSMYYCHYVVRKYRSECIDRFFPEYANYKCEIEYETENEGAYTDDDEDEWVDED